MGAGVYLFCLLPAKTLPLLDGAGMEASQPLLAQVVGDVAAVYSGVALEDFCGAAASERLADLAWVAPRALRHEEVVLSVMRQAPVLPVRFGSVFSSPAALAATLRRHRETLAAFFGMAAGQAEWSLKAFVDRAQAKTRITAARLAAAAAQLAGLAPGKRYVQEQKLKAGVDPELTAWLQETAAGIASTFGALSSASCAARLLSAELSGCDDEMFFHTAFLVPDGSAAGLPRLTAEWNARHGAAGLRLEISGPWPPYHFAPVLDLQE